MAAYVDSPRSVLPALRATRGRGRARVPAREAGRGPVGAGAERVR